ncbi:ribosome maturation factor RimM [Limibacillus halophilus]|jgi:16S rRNA processing protein RimM
MAETQKPLVCLGVVAGAHGVRGLVKVKPFTEAPEGLAAYGPLRDESGSRSWPVTYKGEMKGTALLALEGVGDREAAQALRGTRLYVERDRLPPAEEEGEFYYADLVGLKAETPEGAPLGRVLAVQNYGAGDLLEVGEDHKSSALYPFTPEVVPEVDLAGGRIVIAPPFEV